MSEASDSNPLLSPIQRRLVGVALAMLAAAVIGLFLYGIFTLLRVFVTEFSTVLWPLATAGILALMLRPIVTFFEVRTRLGRIGAIILLYTLVVCVLAVILGFVVPVVFEQAVRLLEYIPILIQDVRTFLAERNPEIQALIEKYMGQDSATRLQDRLSQNLKEMLSASLPALATLREWVGSLITWSAGAAIVPVYLFFFLETTRDVSADLKEQISFIKKDWREDAVFLVREFAGSIVAFFRGQLIIALIMGVLFAIGFSIAGVSFGIVLGLTMGLLNVVPYLGSIIGLSTVLPIAYFQPDGGLLLVGLAIVVFVIVQMIEGYLLTPKIMGKTTGLHPLVIIIAIFFWGTALDGILGMILAIPLTAFFVVAWRLMKKKYLESWNPEKGAGEQEAG